MAMPPGRGRGRETGRASRADLAEPGAGVAGPLPIGVGSDPCEICGCHAVYERACKVLCGNCHTILQSCADL
jgi:hypothetical protein